MRVKSEMAKDPKIENDLKDKFNDKHATQIIIVLSKKQAEIQRMKLVSVSALQGMRQS